MPNEPESDPSTETWTDPVGAHAPLVSPYLASLIDQESQAQIRKWGRQTHAPSDWALITSEEFGEAMKELCDYRFARTRLDRLEARARFVTEVIQTVTLLLKMIRMAEAES